MRFASLGSGSRGNATLLSQRATHLLVDCGFSVRETQRRLARIGLSADVLSGIVVTHEHHDHIHGVVSLARKFQIPVYMTRGTCSKLNALDNPYWHPIEPDHDFSVADIHCHPFTIPHDAAEPVQFVFSDGATRLGLLTDTGMITAHIVANLYRLDALLVECNHDLAMLARSDYSASLRARVGGDYGHLNNTQAAQLLSRIDYSGLQHIVAMHLSQQNNTPALAQAALAAVLGCSADEIPVADQADGFDWRTV
ncbi:MAG: MBL fold metallo-hydrolase [Gammaproteobacteria bacterium]|nr:MBL fold metallo-hydrolase [Gammaproteobacteria bacterium]